jgi:hypothetical protein
MPCKLQMSLTSHKAPVTHAMFEDQSMEVEARDVGMGMSMEVAEQWQQGVMDHNFVQDDEDRDVISLSMITLWQMIVLQSAATNIY